MEDEVKPDDVQEPKKKMSTLKKVAIIFVALSLCGVIINLTSGDDDGKTTAQNKDEAKTQSAPIKKPTVEPKTEKPSVPTEYLNALEQAYQYGETMNMSKDGIYDQLTSEYGGQFEKDAAKYAVDNVKIDWNANAVVQAKEYSKSMNMSKKAVYDQLVSEYGGKFTKKQAQYGVDHMDD